MSAKSVWSLIPLAICLLLRSEDVNGESPCTWKVRLGRVKVDPYDAPEGFNKYVILTNGKEGLHEIANELKKIQAVSNGDDVNSIREMTTLGNMITAKMSKRALIWLCQQEEELNDYIKIVELDQHVTVYTGPVDPSLWATPPPVLEI